MTTKLTPKLQRFVAEYLVDLNACQAYIRAGYSARSAETNGPRTLRNAQVAAAVAAGRARQLASCELTAARVLEELRRLVVSDVGDYFDATGEPRPFADLTPAARAAIASYEVVLKNASAGDGVTDRVLKIKFWDKTRALELACKHLGLLQKEVEPPGEAVPVFLMPPGTKIAIE